MLTAPLTVSVLSIRYPPVVYMLTAPLNVLNIRYPPVVYINSPSHSFKPVRWAVNINYWWIHYV
jgi:hypothetical protein